MSARETLPAEWVVYFFLVEIAGKRAAILVLVGCQRVHDFGPGRLARGRLAQEKGRDPLENWAAKGRGLNVRFPTSTQTQGAQGH